MLRNGQQVRESTAKPIPVQRMQEVLRRKAGKKVVNRDLSKFRICSASCDPEHRIYKIGIQG